MDNHTGYTVDNFIDLNAGYDIFINEAINKKYICHQMT